MIGVFEKQLMLTQTGPDVYTTGVMDLKVDLERNEAFKVRQVVMSIDSDDALNWPALCSFAASAFSPTGSISYGVSLVSRALGFIDCRQVIPVNDAPLAYEDSITISCSSVATLLSNTVRCRVTYEVVQGTELGRTQYLYE